MTSSATPIQLLNYRYHLLDQVGFGGMGTVFRAQDRLTGQIVALKRVHIADRPNPVSSSIHTLDMRVALAQEFKTLASLRHPHIVSVLDYGFVQDGQPYFTMELLEGARTLNDAAVNLAFERKVDLLVQILQALSYLHRRGIIHRDLKPANVMVLNQQVKVIDFGLAASREYLRESPDQMAGTLGYLAPEILQGIPASEVSDLYSVGVMGYELFAGVHPYHNQDPTRVIENILNFTPDPALMDVENELAIVISRLLSKQPEDRFQNAYDTINAILSACKKPVLVESRDIRESFLQAAQFVGRTSELQQLNTALTAASQGQGSAWLVGGESGVGKTRLLDELRTQALVEGFTVLRGQAASTGYVSYQLWRDPLRRLLLSTGLISLEMSILKEIVPDIDTLLDVEVVDAPELDGKGQQQRIVLTIVDVFRKQKHPVLLLLEDMHWAQESLEPLKYLIRVVAELPILIVGSYRDEEAPHLPEVLTEMQVLKLDRLTPAAIEELSASMLGTAGQHPQLVDLLNRETEGNTFFIVEVVRTLIEEYGGVAQIGRGILPSKVVSGGIQSVIQRRLSRVPAYALEPLKISAVIGRQIDLNLLRHLAPDLNSEKWLTDCAEFALLEVFEERWRFAHDKIRDVLVNSITEDERPVLYRRIAEATEKLYQHDPAFASSLAEYWAVVGDVDKSVTYACRAGELAIVLSNYKDAEAVLSLALSMIIPDGQPQLQMRVLSLLGDASWRTGNYTESKSYYEQGLKLSRELNNSLMISDILNGIAMVSYMMGENDQSTFYAQEAMEVAYENHHQKNTARALNTLGMIAEFEGKFETANRYYGQGLQLFRTIQDWRGTASALNNLGTVADACGSYDAARDYYEESLKICKTIGYRQGISALLNNLGVIAERLGDYVGAQQYYQESLDLAIKIGNRRGRLQSLANMVFIYIWQEKTEEARAYLNQALSLVNTDYATVIPHILAGVAQLKFVDRDFRSSAEVMGYIKTLSGADSDFMATRFNPLIERLQNVLREDELHTFMQHGAQMDFKSLLE